MINRTDALHPKPNDVEQTVTAYAEISYITLKQYVALQTVTLAEKEVIRITTHIDNIKQRRDEYIRILSKLQSELDEQHSVYLQACAHLDNLTNSLKEVGTVITSNLIDQHGK